METALTCLYFAMLVVALQVLTISICARHDAMWPWRRFFQVMALVWLAMALAKKGYIDEVFPPSDALEHEAVAREVAELLSFGRFSEAFSYFGAGNPAYQFLVGVFYAVSDAPEVVIYAINGALGFWGLLVLLECLCRQSNCLRLPASVVAVIGLLPSGLLWTTTNLKEGPILWGICVMCYWTVPAASYRGRPPRLLPLAGLLVVMAMRPHIAVAWLVAIGAGTLLHTKRSGLLLASAAGAMASVALLSVWAPSIFEQAVRGGISSTLSHRYDELSTNDSINGAALAGSDPIPVLSGLPLIMFRPWPTEAQQMEAFLAGLEVWALAAFGLMNWRRSRGKFRWRMHPELVTHVVALLLLAYYFTYMYNMGLVVRQRLMCFPAVLFLYIYPLLAMQGASRSRLPSGRLGMPKPVSVSLRSLPAEGTYRSTRPHGARLQ